MGQADIVRASRDQAGIHATETKIALFGDIFRGIEGDGAVGTCVDA